MHYPYLPKASEVKAARFQKFMHEFAMYESDYQRHAAQDRFLDAYSIWLRHRSPVTYENLAQTIETLRALDPGFHFPSPARRGISHA